MVIQKPNWPVKFAVFGDVWIQNSLHLIGQFRFLFFLNVTTWNILIANILVAPEIDWNSLVTILYSLEWLHCTIGTQPDFTLHFVYHLVCTYLQPVLLSTRLVVGKWLPQLSINSQLISISKKRRSINTIGNGYRLIFTAPHHSLQQKWPLGSDRRTAHTMYVCMLYTCY